MVDQKRIKKQQSIIGRNILPKIGIKLIQDKPNHNQILNITEKDKASDEEKTELKRTSDKSACKSERQKTT